ncbi:MAG: hypothetical protein V2B19_30820 [Pseudomonadota bacterium]
MAELFKAILNKDIALIWVELFSMLIPFVWSFSKCRHRRYRNNILFVAAIVCSVITFQILEFIPITKAAILYVLCGFYLVTAGYTARSLLFPESSTLFLLKKLVREGNYNAIEVKFPQIPLYIQSILAKMEWHSLLATKLIGQGRPREAYETYSRILNLPLFEDEETDIRLKQVLCLLLLGDTNKAQRLFERVKVGAEKLRSYELLFIQSIIYERSGEFEKARQHLLVAVEEHDCIQSVGLAMAYNNLGRMEKMLGNTTNVVHYYRKAAELASRHHDKDLIHTVYPNIIDVSLLINDNDSASSYFSKYSQLIDKDIIDDLLKFNNYCLEYSRQTGNRAFFIETLVRGRIDILPGLTEQERYAFEVSELRIRWNNQCGWDEKLFGLNYHLPEYLRLTFPSRYHLIKEIFIILRDLARANSLGPFAIFFSQVLQFMGQSKQDIDRYLIDLPDHCVDERCFWEKEKAFLRKVQRTNEPQKPWKEFCEGLFKHLRDIKAIQLQHGNPLPAIEADLNIADECMGLAQEIQEESIITYLQQTLKEHLDQA